MAVPPFRHASFAMQDGKLNVVETVVDVVPNAVRVVTETSENECVLGRRLA
jgi:hypothetical protein